MRVWVLTGERQGQPVTHKDSKQIDKVTSPQETSQLTHEALVSKQQLRCDWLEFNLISVWTYGPCALLCRVHFNY